MRKFLIAIFVVGLAVTLPVHAALTTTVEAAVVAAGAPGTWTFTVGGWDGGGAVSGSFAGVDGDGNGQLSSFDGEVTAFAMSYSGGTIVGAFALAFADLFGLVYDLDGGVLGDGVALDVEGILAAAGAAVFGLGPGPVTAGVPCTGTSPCGVIEGPGVSVTEPSAIALALAGFGLLAGWQRRRAR